MSDTSHEYDAEMRAARNARLVERLRAQVAEQAAELERLRDERDALAQWAQIAYTFLTEERAWSADDFERMLDLVAAAPRSALQEDIG